MNWLLPRPTGILLNHTASLSMQPDFEMYPAFPVLVFLQLFYQAVTGCRLMDVFCSSEEQGQGKWDQWQILALPCPRHAGQIADMEPGAKKGTS